MKAKLALTVSAALSLGLAACAETAAPPTVAPSPAPAPAADAPAPLPPLRAMLDCLPSDAALLAAHRGTGTGVGAPENSLSGLEALIEAGVLMAEIDIAKIADGTLISFHDGVWEEKSSGTGPVVATPREAFDRIRLRLEEGGTVGGEPVPLFTDMLEAAKGRIYLELDFKTSADIGRAVQMVRDAGMSDHVVLIASSAEEAKTLKAFGDEFVLSLPYQSRKRSAGDRQGVWVGGRWREDAQAELRRRHYTIGSQWTRRPDENKRAQSRLDIIATDQPLRGGPIAGLKNRAAFDACVAQAALD